MEWSFPEAVCYYVVCWMCARVVCGVNGVGFLQLQSVLGFHAGARMLREHKKALFGHLFGRYCTYIEVELWPVDFDYAEMSTTSY